jgi:hypothetical protein
VHCRRGTLVNKDGTVILWKKAAERLLGFLVKDMIGRPFFVGQV